MRYDQALQLWGARKLDEWAETKAANLAAWSPWPGNQVEKVRYEPVDPATVTVSFEFDEGAHYGGSQDYSASASVRITGTGTDQQWHDLHIEPAKFNFAAVLGEIVAVADGTITA